MTHRPNIQTASQKIGEVSMQTPINNIVDNIRPPLIAFQVSKL